MAKSTPSPARAAAAPDISTDAGRMSLLEQAGLLRQLTGDAAAAAGAPSAKTAAASAQSRAKRGMPASASTAPRDADEHQFPEGAKIVELDTRTGKQLRELPLAGSGSGSKSGSGSGPAARSTASGRGGPPDPTEPWLLEAIMMSLPLTLLHAFFDYIVHMQYGLSEDFTLARVARRQGAQWPFLVGFMYVVARFRRRRIVQLAMCLAGIALGVLMVDVTRPDQTFGQSLRAPGLSVLWIYLIIQMDITWGAASLAPVALYYFRESLSFILAGRSGSMQGMMANEL